MANYFSVEEQSCHCGCGLNEVADNPDFLSALNTARTIYGKPMRVTCMTRCPAHNAAVGGAPDSTHMQGRAVDIACTDPGDRADLHDALWKAGFRRFELSGIHVHADMRVGARPVLLLKLSKGGIV